MTHKTLKEDFPRVKVRKLSELFKEGLDLSAVNGQRSHLLVEQKSGLDSPTDSEKTKEIHVPFLVVEQYLEKPILGFNVIEELVKIDFAREPIDIVASVKAGFLDKEDNKLTALVNLIQAPAEDTCVP